MANLERHGRVGRGEGWSRNGGESGGVSDKIKFVAYTMRSVPASLRRCACLLCVFFVPAQSARHALTGEEDRYELVRSEYES